MLIIKILSLGAPERYAVRRMVTAAYQDLLQQYPNLEINIIDVSDSTEIGKVCLHVGPADAGHQRESRLQRAFSNQGRNRRLAAGGNE